MKSKPANELCLRNRQRTRRVSLRKLRRMVKCLLRELLVIEYFELGIYLVAAPEMTRLNERFLRHAGSTDVIAFDHSDLFAGFEGVIYGEIYVCVDEALIQSRRFRTSWQSELARYVVHGVLHLLGYDDSKTSERRRMKREENRLLKALGCRCLVSLL